MQGDAVINQAKSLTFISLAGMFSVKIEACSAFD
jgi:hypothetical protein